MKKIDYKTTSPMRIFLSFFRPHWKLFALDMICALLVAAVDLAFPVVSRLAMYDLLPNQKFRTFFIIMAVVVLSYIIRALLYYIITVWGHTFGIRVETDIRKTLFVHLQEMSFSFYDQNRTGRLMSRLTTDLFELTELAHHGPEDILISVATIIGALIVMLTIEWRLAIVVCVILPLFLVVVVVLRNRMSSTSKAVKKKTAAINAEIESNLSGVRTAKAFANEAVEEQKFDCANKAYRNSKHGFYRAMGEFLASAEFLISLLSVAVIGWGGYLIMKNQLDYRDLIVFSLYITTFVNPIRKLANFSELFANGFAGLHRFVELMRMEPAITDAPDAKPLENVQGHIEVKHVSFSYDGEVPVLKDIDLEIKPGETVAVVGPSGGGKSTLCQLLPRFYDVTQGAVCIDGQDIRGLTQLSLRASIGIVQQDVFLFADTIFENIRYGKPDATYEEVVLAAKRAELYDDIQQMPDGFDTYVGERGALLSGGQKQRLSIARIFLANPPILILDEATSALDSLTEAKIQHTFDALTVGRTTLIIAHRLSTIKNAGRIIVVADGQIVESGTHDSLLRSDGAYAALWRTQNAAAGHKQESY